MGRFDSKPRREVHGCLISMGLSVYVDRNGGDNNVKLRVSSRHLWMLMGLFGDLANGKRIPPLAIGAEKRLLNALVLGYRAADGSESPRRMERNELQAKWRIASVNLPLLRDLQRVLLKSEIFGFINKVWDGGPQVIEGRTVNTLPRWELTVRLDPKKRPTYEFKNGAVWVRVRDVAARETKEPVWNLEVKGDDTFCVQLMATHNCKGYSGLLSAAKSGSDKYQALNRLTIRGFWLALEAWKDDPPAFFIMENVPRILTRGRHFLDQIIGVLQQYGYAVAETTHDCGELGGLGQKRKRFLLVARHREKVPPFLYEPPKKKLLTVGDVLGRFPLPDDPRAGPMHHSPRLQWRTWVRLAFVQAGADWRSLERLEVEAGNLKDYGIVPVRNIYRVVEWDGPSGAVTSGGGPSAGGQAIADPRHQSGFESCLGVMDWEETSGAICSRGQPTSGKFSIADPRSKNWDHAKYRVTDWDESTGTVISASTTGQGAFALADPRVRIKSDRTSDPRVPDATELPSPTQNGAWIIRALDGTWHRPFTTLELAALQGLVEPNEHFDLDGKAHSAWRARIGNAVPAPAAQAIASVIGQTLLLAWTGQRQLISDTPIWVRPVAVAMAVDL